jgi:hypothetical protein
MTMQRNTNRILTTRCGSLARPADLLDLMKAKLSGAPYDLNAYEQRIRSAVAEIVHKQVETGVDARHVQPRGSSDCCVSKISGHGGRRAPSHATALAVSRKR